MKKNLKKKKAKAVKAIRDHLATLVLRSDPPVSRICIRAYNPAVCKVVPFRTDSSRIYKVENSGIFISASDAKTLKKAAERLYEYRIAWGGKPHIVLLTEKQYNRIREKEKCGAV